MKWFDKIINWILRKISLTLEPEVLDMEATVIQPPVPRKYQPTNVDKLNLLRPVHEKYPISSPYGYRSHPKPSFHKGIDFACPVGTEVYAMADGSIFRTGWEDLHNEDKGLGLRVWQEFVYEGITYYGWYGHLSAVLIDIGQKVNKGDLVGLSGNTGSSTGPHLHVQVREINTGHFYDIEFYTQEA